MYPENSIYLIYADRAVKIYIACVTLTVTSALCVQQHAYSVSEKTIFEISYSITYLGYEH